MLYKQHFSTYETVCSGNVELLECGGAAQYDVAPYREIGIDEAQAAELQAQLGTFAEEWNSPEMDLYDNYDAVKAQL